MIQLVLVRKSMLRFLNLLIVSIVCLAGCSDQDEVAPRDDAIASEMISVTADDVNHRNLCREHVRDMVMGFDGVEILEFEKIDFNAFKAATGERVLRYRREGLSDQEVWSAFEGADYYRMKNEQPTAKVVNGDMVPDGNLTLMEGVCITRNEGCYCFTQGIGPVL